jgi:membrane-associated protein
MDQVFSQLVQFVSTVPPSDIYVVYLLAGVWMAIESLGIGVPIEPVLLLLGALASQGKLNPVLGVSLALGAVTLGTLVGATIAYGIGRVAGRGIVRVGQHIGLTPTRVDHMEVWLRRRGALGIFLARFVPVLRGLAPYVIGALREPVAPFAIGTAAGALGYAAIWVVLGLILGDNYQAALSFFDQFGALGLAIVVGIIALAVVLHFLYVQHIWRRLSAHFHRHAHQHAPQLTATAPMR